MSTDTKNGLFVEHALRYAGYGWHVIPLRERNKIPLVAAWQRTASTDEDQILEWWGRHEKANVGVQLGKRSNLIDIECDSEQAEEQFLQLFSGDPPVTAMFSARRGKHRLFLWRDDLPAGAVTHVGELEIRTGNDGKGAQSVFPPSIHPSGAEYQWILDPDDAPPIELPDDVVARIWNATLGAEPETKQAKPAGHWQKIAEGVGEGNRNQSAASLVGYSLRQADVFDDEAVGFQWMMIEAWNRGNSPPLEASELRTTFDSILRAERKRRAGANAGDVFGGVVQNDPEKGTTVRGGWRLVIITSEPKQYKLYGPLWDGHILMTSQDYASPGKIKTLAIEQAQVWLPDGFRKAWNGTKDEPSLAATLLEQADFEEDHDEARRSYVIAEQLLVALSGGIRTLVDGDEFPSSGEPVYTEQGDCVFLFSFVHQPMARSDDKIRRNELTALLRQIGATRYSPTIAGSRQRRHRISAEGMDQLRRIVCGASDGHEGI